MVRTIDGIEDPALATAWENYRPVAEELWRARSRLQRGDAKLSEPLFERHFERLVQEDEDSELRLIVAEGLLRARLAHGAVEAALPAALETIRLRRAGVSTSRYAMLPSVIDEDLWLVPALPPIPTDESRSTALLVTLAPWLESEDTYVAALASGYIAMARGTLERSGGTGAGLQMVGSILDAESADPAVRAAARERLREVLDEEDTRAWIHAWYRWFLARSMLMEPDVDVDGALIELLHIPAVHGARSPALASRALMLAADILERDGRFSEAALLRREQVVTQPNVVPALQVGFQDQDRPTGDAPVEGVPTENSEPETP